MSKLGDIVTKLKKFGAKDLADTLIKGAAKTAGSVISNKTGGLLDPVLKQIGEAIGVEGEQDKVLSRLEQLEKAGQHAAVAKLMELDIQYQTKRLEAEVEFRKADAADLAEINETMRAEVLGNPESGSWRPLWGKIGAWAWAGEACLSMIYVGYDVLSGTYGLANYLGPLTAFLFALNAPPLAVLGVSAYHRGKEKIELVKNQDGN